MWAHCIALGAMPKVSKKSGDRDPGSRSRHHRKPSSLRGQKSEPGPPQPTVPATASREACPPKAKTGDKAQKSTKVPPKKTRRHAPQKPRQPTRHRVAPRCHRKHRGRHVQNHPRQTTEVNNQAARSTPGGMSPRPGVRSTKGRTHQQNAKLPRSTTSTRSRGDRGTKRGRHQQKAKLPMSKASRRPFQTIQGQDNCRGRCRSCSKMIRRRSVHRRIFL